MAVRAVRTARGRARFPRRSAPGRARTNAVKRACVIGSSDGIGFATAEALLAEGWEVVGVSRGVSALSHPHYTHFICDVTSDSVGQKRGESTRRHLVPLAERSPAGKGPLLVVDVDGVRVGTLIFPRRQLQRSRSHLRCARRADARRSNVRGAARGCAVSPSK
jgi:NAD(P)-dependent dehydrogenase (short-subunit alcohol dehydrogenase family)